MPQYFIRVLNAEFESRDGGADYDRPETALDAGIRCAAEIVTDEIAEGRLTAAVQVCVEDEKGEIVMRSVVSMSASPLWVRDGSPAVAPTIERTKNRAAGMKS